jgi:hypothetical protein
MKKSVVVLAVILIAVSCQNDEKKKNVYREEKLNETWTYKKSDVDNQIVLINNDQSTRILLDDREIRVFSEHSQKEYFVDVMTGLYKIKTGFKENDTLVLPNEILYIDTTSSSFLITPRSSWVVLSDIPDTVKMKDRIYPVGRMSNPVFSNFEVIIFSSDKRKSFSPKINSKCKMFENKKGFLDTIIPDTPGNYVYHGLIRNFDTLPDGSIVSKRLLFEKKIIVVR